MQPKNDATAIGVLLFQYPYNERVATFDEYSAVVDKVVFQYPYNEHVATFPNVKAHADMIVSIPI